MREAARRPAPSPSPGSAAPSWHVGAPVVEPGAGPRAGPRARRPWSWAPALQAKLRVGAVDDPMEREADRVAEAVVSGASPPAVQRKCAACAEEDGAVRRTPAELPEENEEEKLQTKRAAGAAPEVSPRTTSRIAALRGGGKELSPAARSYFEPRFGRDLSAVRLHTGNEAAAAAREVDARAFTVGRDIAFGAGEYRPDSTEGRRLLAHELTHTVQQEALGPRVHRTPDDPPQPSPTSPWKTGQQCGRDNRENTDFPNTRIEQVDIDVSDLASGMSLTWRNPTGLSLPTGPFPICPGAGKCCDDCDDETTSTTTGSLCTPKGDFRVHTKGCQLSTAWAKNPTYFSRAGIAIHSANAADPTGPTGLPGYPASHGCVRTTAEASAIIHDNSVYSRSYAADPERGLSERRTRIVVSGSWAGSRCYRGSSLRSRSAECPAARGSGGGSGSATGAATPGAEPADSSQPAAVEVDTP